LGAIALVSALAVVAPVGTLRLASADGPAEPTALSCQGSSPSTAATSSNEQFAVDVSGAPTESLPGGTFTVAISDPGETLPATLGGDLVTAESNLQVVYPVPEGTTFVSATLSGGSGIGSGPTVDEVADPVISGQNDVVENVPGPIAADQSFSLPTVEMTLEAPQAVGAAITTSLIDVQPAGSSTTSADPAVSSTMQVTNSTTGPTALTDTCWPTSAIPTVLSSTSVVAVDTTPPAVVVTAPTNGAVYTQGQTINAAFLCTDVASYGIASCDGTVPNGSAIDTSTTGEHEFTVSATDLRGTPTQEVVAYYVQVTPTLNVTGPLDAGTLPLTNGTSCSFGGTGCPHTTPAEATYEVVSPVPNGGMLVMGDTFTVQWQIYEPGDYSTVGAGGPDLTWTVPAPAGAVIDGPVTTSASGLDSPSIGQGSTIGAGACTDLACTSQTTAPGIVSVNGESENGAGWTYDAVDQPSVTMDWNENSSPSVGTDGIYLDVTYAVRVTAPGTVTLPGFSALSGSGGLTTASLGNPTPAVSFDVVDPAPPSVTVSSPVDGGVYSFGQVVDAAYGCVDAVEAVTTCSGTVANGGPIDTTTATPGNVHTFTVTATDSVGNTATTQVEYYVQSSPAEANDQSFAVSEGASTTLPILNGVTETDYALDPTSISIVSPPADGKLELNADGTVTYTNNVWLTEANYQQSGSVDDSFTYTVRDVAGNVSNVAKVTLTVLPPLSVSPISSSLSQGITLQQPQNQPTDVLGSMTGSSCGGAALQLSGQAADVCGELAPLTITNDEPAISGWSVSGQIGDFLDPSALPGTTCDAPTSYSDLCIPGGDMGWSPWASVVSVLSGTVASVAPGDAVNAATPTVENPVLPSDSDPLTWANWPVDSAPGSAIAAPDGLHSDPKVLCQAPTNEAEGEFTCGAGLSLTVPASSAAPVGAGYEATLTLTLMLS
jgi:hypothetical protein